MTGGGGSGPVGVGIVGAGVISTQYLRTFGKVPDLEVRFVAETPERTRVELEHRNIDRHGSGWEGVRDGVAGDDGWPLYLSRFADVLTSVS